MICYTNSLPGITAENLDGFFVGWPNPPSPETHLKLLAGSDHIMLAVDDETGNVVGFIIHSHFRRRVVCIHPAA